MERHLLPPRHDDHRWCAPETGVFEYLATWAAKRARGRPYRLMVLLVVITASTSALLDNVTTVLLIAPVTFQVCERLALPVVPYLIAEAMASSIGGTSTLIGDPPNIIVASRGGLTFNDFLLHLIPLVVVLMAVFAGLCRILFRYDPERAADIMELDEREAIADRRLLWQSLAVLTLVMTAFVLHPCWAMSRRWSRCRAPGCWSPPRGCVSRTPSARSNGRRWCSSPPCS
ncbi:SLC13 family permease [Nonomuraea polychroma]|uniref:SLC13 family permease n=1 Tax=Nonomuraea polychroma TaxID=46176 RepID=UPI003D8DF614